MSRKRKSPDDLEQARALRAKGWKVRPPGEWVLKTFEVDAARYRDFRALAAVKGLKVKEALDIALREWIHRYTSGRKSSGDVK